MHSSCNVHDKYFCGMFSTCFLQGTWRSTCAWYMMWWRRYVFVLNRSSSLTCDFLNGLSVVRRPVVTFHVEGCARFVFIRARYVYSCTIRARSVLFVRDLFPRARSVFFVRDLYSSCAIGISFCAPRARDVFCRSRVQTPDHAARSFYWSQVRFRGLVACFRLVESVAYVNDLFFSGSQDMNA